MMNNKPLILILILAVSFSACKKDEAETPVGDITLSVEVKHHTVEIPNARVYLKFNTTEFPGKDTSLYNVSMTSDAHGIATFSQLFAGHYYLYGEGYDGADSVMGYQYQLLDAATAGTTVNTVLFVTE